MKNKLFKKNLWNVLTPFVRVLLGKITASILASSASFWLKITHNAVPQEERQKFSFHGKFNSFHIFLAYYLPMM